MTSSVQTTTSFRKIARMRGDIRVVQGGSRAGKTYAILQLLIIKALTGKLSGVVSIVAESMPHINRGVWRDFEAILQSMGLWDANKGRRSPLEYPVGDCTFEFFGADKPDNLRGASRRALFINECNRIVNGSDQKGYEAAWELIQRTSGPVYLDFNPVREFWVHTRILPLDGQVIDGKVWDVSFEKLTLFDNEFVPAKMKAAILARAEHDEDYKRWALDGEVGNPTDVIFPGSMWGVGKLPENAKYICSGMDFGESAPTTLVDLYIFDGVYWYDCVHYSPGVDVWKLKEAVGKDRAVVADPSHATIIRSLRKHAGLTVREAKKFSGSVEGGIALMKQAPFMVVDGNAKTPQGAFVKELRGYEWDSDRMGVINRPKKGNDHAIDAARYARLFADRVGYGV